MSFDHKKFRNTIIQKYGNLLNEEIIDELLNLGDESHYSRDTPISTGKRLTLVNLTLQGKKSDETEINFFYKFEQGINIIIADNLKGKSSVFKAIQLALTGNDNLKHDIKKWLHVILLNFRINEQDYCVYINLESKIFEGSLYRKKIRAVEDIKLSEIPTIFNERGLKNFSKEMELFFFNQFSYYSLQWTQKSPQKNSNKLLESNSSWHTYFKSIFLESKDTNLWYGAQEKKIFQMLLGLHLTYPINRLKIKKDMKESEKAKRVDSNESRVKSIDINKNNLKIKIINLNTEIEKLKISTDNEINFEQYSDKRRAIIGQINQTNKEDFKRQSELHKAYTELRTIEVEEGEIKQEVITIRKNILKIIKAIQDLHQFLDIGRFFSNLNVKYCPCCNKQISSSPINPQKNKMECVLCHDIVDSEEDNQNQLKHLEKIESFNEDKEKYLELQKEKETSLENLQQKKQEQWGKIHSLENRTKTDIPYLLTLQEELTTLDTSLFQQQNTLRRRNDQLDSLIAQKAIAEFQLNQNNAEITSTYNDSLEHQIDMLEFAINLLEKERYNSSQKVLSDLSNLMLEELNLFGLTTFTEIKISEDFDISYKQDGEFVKFNNIAEGEQLRVKISLYLSLIQLDVKYNFGKHTRFLIIDSPSKEEGDSIYLEGLSTLLKGIEDRFKDQLQILIGTAERKLSGIVANETILDEGKYLF